MPILALTSGSRTAWASQGLALGGLCCLLGLAGCDSTPPAQKSPPAEVSAASTSETSAIQGADRLQVTPDPGNSRPAVVPDPGPKFIFRDATQEWGLQFVRYDDMHGLNRILEVNGGGTALFDYDLDGRLDLFFAQGNHLPRANITSEFTNELCRNRQPGRFESVTGPSRLTAHAFYTGCAVGDFDADGFPDLYVAGFGTASLWHNNGDGTFQNVTQDCGVSLDRWGTSVVFADFNGDGWLDLYVVAYVQANDDPAMICHDPHSPTRTIQCTPSLFAASDDLLFVNDGQGRFVNVTQPAGVTGLDGKGLGVVSADFNGDGWLDLYVANDGTPCFLYLNETATQNPAQAPGTDVRLPKFREQGIEWGVALNAEGRATSAMGIAHGDYDRDGWLDLLVTNFYLEPNTLFHNVQGTGFVDWSTPTRLGPPSRSTLAFGTEFLDVDHDDWLDLVVTTGHIEDRTWTGTEPYRMRPHLFRNDRNGRFTDVAATAGDYFTHEWVGRGLAVGDVDRDGDLDLVMAQQVDPSVLLLNETPPASSSVVIKPVGREQAPRSGIGVRARVPGLEPVLLRDVAGGGSFQSVSALELHLPLHDRAEFEELELIWPGGHIDRPRHVEPGYYVAIEGRGLFRLHP